MKRRTLNLDDYRQGFQAGWQQSLLGEPKVAPPHQGDDYLAGFEQGYADAKARPTRRAK